MFVPIIRRFAKNLTLTYDSDKSYDGLGAQLHRIIAIYSLAKVLNVRYQHRGIRHSTWHPFDDFRSEGDFIAYLASANSIFDIEGNSSDFPTLEIEVPRLNFRKLFSLSIRSYVSRKNHLISICEPFGVLDYVTKRYRVVPDFPEFMSIVENTRSKHHTKTIAIHYRHGSGNFALYHNQKLTRQLPLDVFAGKLKSALNTIKSDKFEDISILFVTDAPELDLEFSVPQGQWLLWENTPGYHSGVLKIKGLSNIEIKRAFGNLPNFSIIRGGNPISALGLLASADCLIMSRSSLSYVAGLYCRGMVYYPHDFWHPKQREWKD